MASSGRRAEARLAVFAKAPVPGTVKTRLAGILGEAGAAALHEALARRALATACAAGAGPVELWCAPDARHPFFARCAAEFGVALRAQSGADLGARMAHAFDAAFAEGASLVILGADCPALAPSDVRRAAEAARHGEVAIAPAEDGGYAMIAMGRSVPGLFDDVSWGGTTVMEETRERLRRAGVAWQELPTTWDVDEPADYARLAREGLLGEAPR